MSYRNLAPTLTKYIYYCQQTSGTGVMCWLYPLRWCRHGSGASDDVWAIRRLQRCTGVANGQAAIWYGHLVALRPSYGLTNTVAVLHTP